MRLITKTAIFFAAVMLVSAVTALTVYAQPFGMGMGKERGHARLFVEPILVGHGFALKGDEYHILDVNAIKMGDVSPGFIRSLLGQKKSSEEIAREISDAQTATNIRAHLRFAGQAYTLNITAYDNKSLAGDILTLPPRGTSQTGFTPVAAGHISLSISEYEGEMSSTGTITMNGTDYKVLLTSPIKPGRW